MDVILTSSFSLFLTGCLSNHWAEHTSRSLQAVGDGYESNPIGRWAMKLPPHIFGLALQLFLAVGLFFLASSASILTLGVSAILFIAWTTDALHDWWIWRHP